MLRLQPYKFKVRYIPGKANIAYVLSRLAEFQTPPRNIAEEYVRAVTQSSIPKTMTAKEVERASKDDVELEKVRECIKTGDFSSCDVAYRAVRDELAMVGYVILRQTRIVIPTKLRKEVLSLAHQGHQGIVKTKMRLREKVWWPGIDMDCKKFCKQCHGCQVVSQPNHPEPVESSPLPEGPWQDLALDFLGPFPTGEQVLVIVDYYSRYFIVKIMKTITAEKVIEALEEMIDQFGIPVSLTTDNGPQLVSTEFEDYLEQINAKNTERRHQGGPKQMVRWNDRTGRC